MIFQVRTDNHLKNSEKLIESIRTDIEATLGSRYGDRLHRVEVYLEDVNGGKGGIDTRCSIEVHLAGKTALVAEDRATDVQTALDGAIEKVTHVIEKQLGRQEDRAPRMSAAGPVDL